MARKRPSKKPSKKSTSKKKATKKKTPEKRTSKKTAQKKKRATKKRATKKRATKKRATKKRATKKRATKKRATRGRPRPRPVDRTAKRAKRALLLLAGIKRLLHEANYKRYRVGQQLNKLEKAKLHDAVGYDNFNDMIRGEGLPSPTLMRMYMQVAKTYDEQTFNALGLKTAYELYLFTEATPAHDIASELAKQDVKIANKPISEHTARSLKLARENLKRPKEPESSAQNTEHLVKQLLEAKGIPYIHVVYRNLDGEWVIDIRLRLEDATGAVK